MIDPRTLQSELSRRGFNPGSIDGKFGAISLQAGVSLLKARGVSVAGWPTSRVMLAIMQQVMVERLTPLGEDMRGNTSILGKVDGIWGPRSQYALELFQNKMRDVNPPAAAVVHQKTVFPRQKDIVAFYGNPGENQVLLNTPYPLYLDWDLNVQVNRFSIHKKCADSAERAMKKILSIYGQEKIHDLGLDQFGGCLNVRKMRGGSAMSMHSWGIAIDWDANRNALRMNSSQALLARPEYAPFLDAWEEEGWISLGRERNFDWMHVQAARL